MAIEKCRKHRILFYPATKDVNHFYINSHLFCLPSEWEGFPNVVAEAMAHGLPVIGFSDCSGVNQLVNSGETGLLASGNADPNSLANALVSLMSDGGLRSKMGSNGAIAIKKYSPKNILNQWEVALKKVALTS